MTMEYTKRTVQSRAGLSQEEALESLQSHSQFKPGTRIASIRLRGNRWVATLSVPKFAGPPFEESDSEEGAPKPFSESEGPPESDSEDEGDESSEPSGPPSDSGDGPPKKKEKGGENAEILTLLHKILQAVGGDLAPEPGLPGGPDHPGGPDIGGPPPPAPMPGAGGPPRPKTKLRPGEVPPGVTPIGSPAFSSVQSNGMMDPMAGGGAMGAPVGPAPTTGGPNTCPTCGGPEINGVCPNCGGNNYNGGMGGVVGKVRSFTASKKTTLGIADAKRELEAKFAGYRVKQAKRDGDTIRALLVRE